MIRTEAKPGRRKNSFRVIVTISWPAERDSVCFYVLFPEHALSVCLTNKQGIFNCLAEICICGHKQIELLLLRCYTDSILKNI